MMDCSLLLSTRCSSSSPRKSSRSIKKQWSSKRRSEECLEESTRDWPVEASEYELLQFAGKGAHAVVHKGRCKLYDEVVAIKRLDLDSSWDLTALIREATLMKRFNHPALLPLHAAFVAGRELWFVTPYMGLGSVRSIMKQHFPLGLDEVLIATIMEPVLLALEYVHRNNGIHRDVKADNILVSEECDVVLADFGVAAARMRPVSMVNLAHDMQSIMATTFVGTPCWMAPEVMQQSEEGYHTSADIWSFGITLIELAHGRPPLARMNPMRVLMDTMTKPPPRLEDHPNGKSFSKAFKELVEECLQKDPDKRPTASALLKSRFFRMSRRDPAFLMQHFLLRDGSQQQQQPVAGSPGHWSPNALGVPQAQQVAGPAAESTFQLGRLQVKQQVPQHGRAAAAGVLRVASGFLSGNSSSGPSRLTSSWLFPPSSAVPSYCLSSTGTQQVQEEQQHSEAHTAVQPPPKSVSSASAMSSRAASVGRAASGTLSCSAAPSLASTLSGSLKGAAAALRQVGSLGSAGSLEQQLQPFIAQQAALRTASARTPSSVMGPNSATSQAGLSRAMEEMLLTSTCMSTGPLEAHLELEDGDEAEEQQQQEGDEGTGALDAEGSIHAAAPTHQSVPVGQRQQACGAAGLGGASKLIKNHSSGLSEVAAEAHKGTADADAVATVTAVGCKGSVLVGGS